MIDVTIHYRGEISERRRLPAVPVVGASLFGPGQQRRLWEVSAVVFDGDGVGVFAAEVSPRLAGELTAAWSAWADTTQIQEARA
jgi:hypothetical protein